VTQGHSEKTKGNFFSKPHLQLSMHRHAVQGNHKANMMSHVQAGDREKKTKKNKKEREGKKDY